LGLPEHIIRRSLDAWVRHRRGCEWCCGNVDLKA
jgi:hypothetical protein